MYSMVRDAAQNCGPESQNNFLQPEAQTTLMDYIHQDSDSKLKGQFHNIGVDSNKFLEMFFFIVLISAKD